MHFINLDFPILQFELFLDAYNGLIGKKFIFENEIEKKETTISMCDYCNDILSKNHRYHCSICTDYDLCETCYKSNKMNGKHNSKHKMKKK